MSENIDKIVYINMEKRKDRRSEIESELNNFNLPFERFEGIETKGFGTLGCGKSHLAVLKIAKERGYKNILILEDDFMFMVTKECFEELLTNFFNSNINYDVCMISYNLRKYETTDYNFMHKVLEAQTASGYIVHKNYYDKLINLYEYAMPLLEQTKQHWNYANDQIWKTIQANDNWYCFIKRIGKQRPSYSDNSESFADYPDC